MIALLGAVLITSSYAFSPAPEQNGPENNLKVLPKDISRDELMQVMHSFETALGMECGDCHARSATDPTKLDFAADSKHKDVALGMMKMVQEMNSTYFNVKGDFKTNYLTSAFEVTCVSCHNGHEHPVKTIAIPLPDPKRSK